MPFVQPAKQQHSAQRLASQKEILSLFGQTPKGMLKKNKTRHDREKVNNRISSTSVFQFSSQVEMTKKKKEEAKQKQKNLESL